MLKDILLQPMMSARSFELQTPGLPLKVSNLIQSVYTNLPLAPWEQPAEEEAAEEKPKAEAEEKPARPHGGYRAMSF